MLHGPKTDLLFQGRVSYSYRYLMFYVVRNRDGCNDRPPKREIKHIKITTKCKYKKIELENTSYETQKLALLRSSVKSALVITGNMFLVIPRNFCGRSGTGGRGLLKRGDY